MGEGWRGGMEVRRLRLDGGRGLWIMAPVKSAVYQTNAIGSEPQEGVGSPSKAEGTQPAGTTTPGWSALTSNSQRASWPSRTPAACQGLGTPALPAPGKS